MNLEQKYNFDNGEELVKFLNKIFTNSSIAKKAPDIMKFFILTRNYGQHGKDAYIKRILNGDDVEKLAAQAIIKGISSEGKKVNVKTFTETVIKNYIENGYYFYSFSDSYKELIEQNGLKINKIMFSDIDSQRFADIMETYMDSSYFKKVLTQITLTGALDDESTINEGIQSPEWLKMFLLYSCPNNQIEDIWNRGDYNQLVSIAKNSIEIVKENMMKKRMYSKEDYHFLQKFILSQVKQRFENGNNKLGIVLIPKSAKIQGLPKLPTCEDLRMIGFYNLLAFSKTDYHNILTTISSVLFNSTICINTEISKENISIVSFSVNKAHVKEQVEDFFENIDQQEEYDTRNEEITKPLNNIENIPKSVEENHDIIKKETDESANKEIDKYLEHLKEVLPVSSVGLHGFSCDSIDEIDEKINSISDKGLNISDNARGGVYYNCQMFGYYPFSSIDKKQVACEMQKYKYNVDNQTNFVNVIVAIPTTMISANGKEYFLGKLEPNFRTGWYQKDNANATQIPINEFIEEQANIPSEFIYGFYVGNCENEGNETFKINSNYIGLKTKEDQAIFFEQIKNKLLGEYRMLATDVTDEEIQTYKDFYQKFGKPATYYNQLREYQHQEKINSPK